MQGQGQKKLPTRSFEFRVFQEGAASTSSPRSVGARATTSPCGSKAQHQASGEPVRILRVVEEPRLQEVSLEAPADDGKQLDVNASANRIGETCVGLVDAGGALRHVRGANQRVR